MKKYLILIAVCLPLLATADSSKTINKEVYNISDASSCLDYQGYERGSGGMILHFRNRCDFNVFAIACVTYPNGAQEIKKSGSRIPYNGRWNTTFFDGTRPQSVNWAATMSSAQLPPSCGP